LLFGYFYAVLGTISFGEFSSVLEQSVHVQDAESGQNETAAMDTSDANLTQSSSLSLPAGLYCFQLKVYFTPACCFSFF